MSQTLPTNLAAAIMTWRDQTLMLAMKVGSAGTADTETASVRVFEEEEAINAKVRGNRDKGNPVSWDDAKLLIEATLKRSVEILNEVQS